jgi:hypothetical protein
MAKRTYHTGRSITPFDKADVRPEVSEARRALNPALRKQMSRVACEIFSDALRLLESFDNSERKAERDCV